MSLTSLDEALLKIAGKENILDKPKLDETLNIFPKDRESKDWDRIEARYNLKFLELLALKNKMCETPLNVSRASPGNILY